MAGCREVRRRGYDDYENSAPVYYRAVLLNRALHAAEELDRWMTDPWVLKLCDRSQDRKARRLVGQLKKAKRRRVGLKTRA